MDTNLHERWLRGVELNFAWRVVPEEDLQRQYDSSGGNLRLRESVIAMMKREVADRLMRGACVAIGTHTAPDRDGKLAIVPAHLFARPAGIDWETSAVRVHRQTFEDVRVEGLSLAVPFRGKRDSSGNVAEADRAAGRSEEAAESVARLGRPRVVERVHQVVESLRREGLLSGILQKERVARVRERCKAEYPELFPGLGQPSRVTILNALKLGPQPPAGLESKKSKKSK